jgi:hypothetical protein
MPHATSKAADRSLVGPLRSMLLAAPAIIATDLLLRPRLGPALAPQVALIAVLGGALLMLVPRVTAPGNPLPGLLSATLGTALLALAAQALLGPSAAPSAIAFGAAMTALLFFCAGAALLLAPPRLRPAGHGFVLLALAVMTLAPVWLAGLLDTLASVPGSLDALVAANPLTALCAAAQTDFLRTDWFYRHSPLGSLRFDYPPPALMLTAYGLIAAVLAMSLSARRRRLREPAPGPAARQR